MQLPGPYRVRIRSDCFGANPLAEPLPENLAFGEGVPVLIDLSDVDFMEGQSLRDERGELVLAARPVVALDGTLVVATVSTQK